MKKQQLLFIASLFCALSFYAQQKEITAKNAPASIYTSNNFKANLNSATALNKRLGFLSFKFIKIALPDLDFNSFGGNFGLDSRSIFEFKDMKRKPDTFKRDDLKRYQNNKLARKINYKNDPSQWGLHRIENRIQPYFLQKDKFLEKDKK